MLNNMVMEKNMVSHVQGNLVGVHSHSLPWPTVCPICSSPGAENSVFIARLSLCLEMFVCMRPRSSCDSELTLGSVDITGGALTS